MTFGLLRKTDRNLLVNVCVKSKSQANTRPRARDPKGAISSLEEVRVGGQKRLPLRISLSSPAARGEPTGSLKISRFYSYAANIVVVTTRITLSRLSKCIVSKPLQEVEIPDTFVSLMLFLDMLLQTVSNLALRRKVNVDEKEVSHIENVRECKIIRIGTER